MGLSSIVSRSVPIFSGKTIDLSIGGVEKEEERASSFRLLMNLLGLSTVSGFFGFSHPMASAVGPSTRRSPPPKSLRRDTLSGRRLLRHRPTGRPHLPPRLGRRPRAVRGHRPHPRTHPPIPTNHRRRNPTILNLLPPGGGIGLRPVSWTGGSGSLPRGTRPRGTTGRSIGRTPGPFGARSSRRCFAAWWVW